MTVIHGDIMNTDKDKQLNENDMTSQITDSDSSSLGTEIESRGNWVGRLDFILSCVSYAVGLGNIWRFPYLCYRNGGAVFLIPYLTFLLLCGMPLFFLEVSYGQFASLSPITVWRLSPFFKGIGWGMVLISGIVCIYYNIIIAWTLYYLFNSFRATLPWSGCDNEWNTKHCVFHAASNNSLNGSLAQNGSVFYGDWDEEEGSGSVSLNMTGMKRTTPSEEYWEHNVLKISSGIEDMGSIRLELLGCLALAWVAVFLCLCKGVKSSGKVVYFTATFPYMVLIALLIRGVTLPGALDGIKFYVIPQWRKLLNLKVWGEAAMQIFYSIGASWGALITMASYNKFNNNVYRDALIVPLLNSGTSIFAGFVIFSIIGFMAHETGSDIADVIVQGPGLVFVVYPAAVARMPFSPLWSVLFFSMLFTVGLGSQFGMFETMTSAFRDEFPKQLSNKKTLLTAIVCAIEFLLGIPCIMNGGIYFLTLMDWYSSVFSLMVISFTECMVIAWIYGVDRFYSDIALMIGFKPCLWWKACWCFITPAMIMFVLTFSIIIHTPVTYGSYEYPGWAIGIGWVFALCSIVPLPIIMIMKIFQAKGSFWQRVKSQVKAADNWGPALESHREKWLATLPGHSEQIEVIEPLHTSGKHQRNGL